MKMFIKGSLVVALGLFFAGVVFASGAKEDGGAKQSAAVSHVVKNGGNQTEAVVTNKFGKVIEITSSKDLLSMIADNAIVLVKFHAPWCGFCHKIEPLYVDVASKFGDVLFLSVNIDDFGSNQEVQKIVKDVTGLPTIKLYKKGTFVEAIVGGTTKDKIAELVQRHSK